MLCRAALLSGLDESDHADLRDHLGEVMVAFALPRHCFEHVGGFDETLLTAEIANQDLASALLAAGYPAWQLGLRCHHQRAPIDAGPLAPAMAGDARYYWTKWGEYPIRPTLETLARRGIVAFDGRTLSTRPNPRPDVDRARAEPLK